MFITRAIAKTLTLSLRFGLKSRILDQKLTKKERKIAYLKNVKPLGDMSDTLHIVGVTEAEILGLWESFRKETEIVLSSENIGFVLYQFDRIGLLSEEIFDILEPQLRRYSGEYKSRTVFGGIYTALKNNNKLFFDFFTNEFEASNMSLTPEEIVFIAEALNKNTFLTPEDKLQYFTKYFQADFVRFMEEKYKESDITKAINIMKELNGIQYYDERVWNQLFNRLWKLKGDRRLFAYESLMPYVTRFPLAAEVAQHLKSQLSKSADVLWRYNLEEGRYYTNWEMREKSDVNVKLEPSELSFFPTKYRKQIKERYLRLISQGSLKEEKQIEEDKAKALGYAILNRYESEDIEAKNNTFEEEEYEKMFGMDPEEMKKLVQDFDFQPDRVVETKKQQTNAAKKPKVQKGKKGDGKAPVDLE